MVLAEIDADPDSNSKNRRKMRVADLCIVELEPVSRILSPPDESEKGLARK